MKIKDAFGIEHDAELINSPDSPYLEYQYTMIEKRYNPTYGDNRMCVCGHPYHRHFDSYEEMEPVGCKYCGCDNFVERIKPKPDQIGICRCCGGETGKAALKVCDKCASEFEF